MGGKGSGRLTQARIDSEMTRGIQPGSETGPASALSDGYEVQANELDEAISGLMQLETDSISWLYRLWPIPTEIPSKQPAYIDRYIGPIDIADIAAKHGGGIYRVRIKNKTTGIFDAKTFSIAGEPRITMTDFQKAGETTNGLKERLDRLESMITSLGKPNDSTLSRLQELKLMAEIIRPANGNGNIETMVNLFQKGIEVAKMSDGSGENWASLLKAAIPEILPLFKPRPIILRPRDKTEPRQIESAAAAPAKTDGAIAPKPEGNVNKVEFSKFLAQMVAKAMDAGDPPDKVASDILELPQDFLTDDEIDALAATTPAQLEIFCRALLPGRDKAPEFVNDILKALKNNEEET